VLAATAESLPSSGKAALVGLLGVTLGLTLLAVFKARFSALGPFAIYLYSHIAIFILRPLYNATSQHGLNVFSLTDSGWPMILAGAIGALGFICTSLGYALVGRAKRPEPRAATTFERKSDSGSREWIPVDPGRERALTILVFLTFLAGVALYSGYIAHVGGLRNFFALNNGRSAELTEVLATSSGYEVSGLLLTTGASLALLMIGLVRRRRGLVLMSTLFLLVAELPQFMTGSRSQFVPLAVAILIVVMATRPRLITWFRALIFGVPAFVLLFVAPRILRSEVTATNTVRDALEQSFSYDGIMGGFFGSFDTAMIDAFALQIDAQSSGRLELAGGSTYLAALGSIIPRSLWQGKPLAVDTVLNQTLFPDTAAKSIGFSFGIYSEPFFNWGILGVVLIMILFGMALGKASLVLRDSRSIVAFVSMAMASGQMFTLVRGSISFDLQRLLIPLIPLLAIWLISGLFTTDRAGSSRATHPAPTESRRSSV
jgi:oligosaccharide repeat unit polymerase